MFGKSGTPEFAEERGRRTTEFNINSGLKTGRQRGKCTARHTMLRSAGKLPAPFPFSARPAWL
jgi:hypothetical protein